jgi:GTP cyclohydrolase I
MSDRALHLLDDTPAPAGGRHLDLDAAQGAARELLLALGADLEDEGLRETPRRMVEV